MDQHSEVVAVIAATARQFYDSKEGFRIYRSPTNSIRQIAFKRDRVIDTSGLCHILKMDKEATTALVDPNVSMVQLLGAT